MTSVTALSVFVKRAAAVAIVSLLAACGARTGLDQRCELTAAEGTNRTRVADCELAMEDGSHIRLVLIRHVAPDGGALDADVLAFRIYPDGTAERLSTAEAGMLMPEASPH